jgi:hypothetical protein
VCRHVHIIPTTEDGLIGCLPSRQAGQKRKTLLIKQLNQKDLGVCGSSGKALKFLSSNSSIVYPLAPKREIPRRFIEHTPRYVSDAVSGDD